MTVEIAKREINRFLKMIRKKFLPSGPPRVLGKPIPGINFRRSEC